MTYTAGSTILASDYNSFIGDANFTWGTGTVDLGWGQTALTTVSAAGNVTATQWASLVNNLATQGSQTNTTITSRTAPVATNTISIFSNVQTDIDNCNTNRGNAAASGSQYTGWTGTNSKTSDTTGAFVINITNTITFPSADQARYFWNAGGLVKIQVSKTSTGNTGDAEWNDLANTLCGAIWISGRVNGAAQTIAGTSYSGIKKIGGTGTPATLTTTNGWYDLPSGFGSDTTVYLQYADTAPYTSNFITHIVRKNAGLTTLTIQTTFQSGEGDTITGGTAASGATPGTAPCAIVTYYPPSTTYLTNSWGTPTVAATVA